MNNIEIILRRERLEEELKKLGEKKEKINKELSEINAGCSHTIMIRPIEAHKLHKRDFGYLRCLFCGEIIPSHKKYISQELMDKMEKSVTIRMEDYPYYWEKENDVERKLEEMYCNLAKEFPNASDAQIAEKMKEKLSEENEKIIKKEE